jgi:hypothetical protein
MHVAVRNYRSDPNGRGYHRTDRRVHLRHDGSNFRIDSCQYVYNLSASELGVGTYRVDIQINAQVLGSAIFQLK